MEIITGKTGTQHITSDDDRIKQAVLFGKNDYVLNTGLKFKHTLETANLIRIADGDAMMQGTHVRIRQGHTDEVTINSGSSGYKRITLICIRYENNGGIESAKLIAKDGELSTGTPTEPEVIKQDLLKGGTIRELPLYKVTLNGINVEEVKPLFSTVNISYEAFDNVIKTANGSTVIPVAMQKFLNIGATNGPLIIELPVGFNGGIISFDIVISNNTDDDLVRYSIVGQLYTANGGTWTNETRAEASGMAKTDKDDLTVRFGYTANKEKAIIAIGDDSTTWQIPMITIRDFVVYFIKTDMSLWRNGWDCKIGKLSDYTWQRVQEHPNPLKISQETIDLFKSLGFDPNGGGTE